VGVAQAPDRAKRFSFFQRNKTGPFPPPPPASYSLGTEGPFAGGKVAGSIKLASHFV